MNIDNVKDKKVTDEDRAQMIDQDKIRAWVASNLDGVLDEAVAAFPHMDKTIVTFCVNNALLDVVCENFIRCNHDSDAEGCMHPTQAISLLANQLVNRYQEVDDYMHVCKDDYSS